MERRWRRLTWLTWFIFFFFLGEYATRNMQHGICNTQYLKFIGFFAKMWEKERVEKRSALFSSITPPLGHFGRGAAPWACGALSLPKGRRVGGVRADVLYEVMGKSQASTPSPSGIGGWGGIKKDRYPTSLSRCVIRQGLQVSDRCAIRRACADLLTEYAIRNTQYGICTISQRSIFFWMSIAHYRKPKIFSQIDLT